MYTFDFTECTGGQGEDGGQVRNSEAIEERRKYIVGCVLLQAVFLNIVGNIAVKYFVKFCC